MPNDNEWIGTSGYTSTILELIAHGITFDDNPHFRVVELMDRQGIVDWKDRSDLLWCARQEYSRRRAARLA